MDQRKFIQINGVICNNHLQQSFLRMNMAFKIRSRKLPKVVALVDMIEDIIDNGSEGSQFLGIFIGDPDTKFFFDRHESFEHIEGVKAEVVVYGCVWSEVLLIYAQFLVKDQPHFSRNLRLINNRVHNQ